MSFFSMNTLAKSTLGTQKAIASDEEDGINTPSRLLHQRAITEECDWGKVTKLFTDRHAKTLHERHAKTIQRICRLYSDGLIVRDLGHIQTIINNTHVLISSNEAASQCLMEPLYGLLKLAGGGEAPFLMKATTEVFKAAEVVTLHLSAICELLGSHVVPVQIATARSLAQFSAFSSEKGQKKLLQRAPKQLVPEKPVLQVLPTGQSCSIVAECGAVERACAALVQSIGTNGICVLQSSEGDEESAMWLEEDGNGPRVFTEEMEEKDYESSEEGEEGEELAWAEQKEGMLGLPTIAEPPTFSAMATEDSASSVRSIESESGPIPSSSDARDLQKALMGALSLFTRDPKSASIVTNYSGLLPTLPRFFLGALGDPLVLDAVQVVWNCLEHSQEEAAKTLSTTECLTNIKSLLVHTLKYGFRARDKELRNEILVILLLLTRWCGSHLLFLEVGLVKEVLLVHAVWHVSPTLHSDVVKPFLQTASPEDFEMATLINILLISLSSTPECLECLNHGKFITALIAFLQEDFTPPCKWNTQQIASARISALSNLSEIAPLCPDSYNYSRGNTLALSFLSRVFHKELEVSDGTKKADAPLHRSAEELMNESDEQAGILKLLLSTAPLFQEELGNDGAITILLTLFKNPSVTIVMRADIGLSLAALCKGNADNKRIFAEQGGIDACVPDLSFQPDDPKRRDDILAASLALVWACVAGDEKMESLFMMADGIDALIDLIPVVPAYFRAAVIGLVAQLVSNPDVGAHALLWRSDDGRRTIAQLLLDIWELEDQRVGLITAPLSGVPVPLDALVVGDTERVLSGTAITLLDKEAELDSTDDDILSSFLQPYRSNIAAKEESDRQDELESGPPPPLLNPQQMTMIDPAAVHIPTSGNGISGFGVGSPAVEFLAGGENYRGDDVWMSGAASPVVSKSKSASTAALNTTTQSSQPSASRGAVLSSEAVTALQCVDARVKISAIFKMLGISANTKNLSMRDKLRIHVVLSFLDLRLGEVYREVRDELTAEGIRPVTPDRIALENNINHYIDVAAGVRVEQEESLKKTHHDALSDEAAFLQTTADGVARLLGKAKDEEGREQRRLLAERVGTATRLKMEMLRTERRRRVKNHDGQMSALVRAGSVGDPAMLQSVLPSLKEMDIEDQ